MLSFKDFTNEVLEKLKERLGYKYDFQVTEVEKNNNVKKIAIMAGKHGENSNIVVYMQDYYEKYIKKYIQEYKNYKPNFQPYFKTTFSSNLINWSEGKIEGKSKGNGAVMRISPVGYLFNNEWDIIRQSTLATFPSHYSYEAMDASQTIALIIYYARSGMKKEEIIYMLTKSLKYQPFTKFNTTCNETLPNCLYALFSSNSYEEAIKKVISYGGDTDMNACIVGAMAEALFGIGENLISLANQKLPTEFVNILEEGYSRIKKIALY